MAGICESDRGLEREMGKRCTTYPSATIPHTTERTAFGRCMLLELRWQGSHGRELPHGSIAVPAREREGVEMSATRRGSLTQEHIPNSSRRLPANADEGCCTIRVAITLSSSISVCSTSYTCYTPRTYCRTQLQSRIVNPVAERTRGSGFDKLTLLHAANACGSPRAVGVCPVSESVRL